MLIAVLFMSLVKDSPPALSHVVFSSSLANDSSCIEAGAEANKDLAGGRTQRLSKGMY